MLTRRAIILSLSAASVALLMAAEAAEMPALIVYNASPSAPTGLYLVRNGRPLARGDLVLVGLPESWRGWAVERGYIGRDVPLVKRVVALSGDHVCASEDGVFVNGKWQATALGRDGRGRWMPVWRGCRKLEEGEFFALMRAARTSLDGRYFGPLPRTAIIGRLIALWTG